MMARAYFAALLCSMVISLSWGLTVDIPAPTYEFARGDNITIPCNFKPKKPDNPAVTIAWTAHADNPDDPDMPVISVFLAKNSDPVTDEGELYPGRASVQYDVSKGVANLILKSVTSKDTRVFVCDVVIPGDGSIGDTTKVVVLVAPTKPICKIQGKAEYYQDINLTCLSEEGTPTPTYQWTSYDVQNNSRPNPPKSTDVNGVLSLYNISATTSGFYICTSKNKIRSEICNMTLAVMPPSMNIASTAGIIGACVAAVIALVVIVCCCRRCNKKKNAEEYAMGVKQDGEYTDRDHEIEEYKGERVEGKLERSANQRDQYEDRSEQDYDHRSDRYSDRRDDSDDRRAKSDDRYDDRRSDRYDDRRSDRYDDRSSDRYDDRRNDRYDDRRSDRNDDHDRNDDRGRYGDNRNERRDQYDDRRDRYDDRRDDRDRPALKPPRA